MILITEQQLQQRRQWDLKLMNGECTLADCIGMCMGLGVPASDYLRQRFEEAITSYSTGECADLAQPFGILMGKREKNSGERETWISHVKYMVDCEAEKGKPKTDPSHYDNTAFHSAGKILNKSPHQIFDTYYDKK